MPDLLRDLNLFWLEMTTKYHQVLFLLIYIAHSWKRRKAQPNQPMNFQHFENGNKTHDSLDAHSSRLGEIIKSTELNKSSFREPSILIAFQEINYCQEPKDVLCMSGPREKRMAAREGMNQDDMWECILVVVNQPAPRTRARTRSSLAR